MGADPALEGVKVHVMDGVVTLEGVVEEERAKARAGALAEGVYGVEEVDNRLRVRPSSALR